MQPALMEKKARLIAFYLPQFHPIPENDAWWGKGFTEWTNVSQAQPLFPGHVQPRIPADLGFYDLRLPEARLAQAELAEQHGLEGFCYWHYWFLGKRLLGRPFQEVLASGQPPFPFCLAWANETWSRRWIGEERDILIKQEYSPEDDVNHARWLVQAFADPRYTRVQGRPLFIIYRPLDLPNPKMTTDTIRQECVRHGLPEPFLIGNNSHCCGVDCRTLGFDGTLNFEPQLGSVPGFFDKRGRMDDRIGVSKLLRNWKLGIMSPKLKICDYAAARRFMRSKQPDHPLYPSIVVAWDNTPRRGRNAIIFIQATPEKFEAGLGEMIQSVQHKPYDDRLVFVNAWNEWAEGNYLEPDLHHGLQYLRAVQRANSPSGSNHCPPTRTAVQAGMG